MPELPEVETTVRGLRKKVLKRTFVDVWTDFSKMIKKPKSFNLFKKEIKGRKIEKVWRRGKNILFDLSGDKTLLIHQKLSGHLLFGKWKKQNNNWQAPSGSLSDRVNSFIHLLFVFKDGQMLALSDLRKFAKVELWNSAQFLKSEQFKKLGPEPLKKDFTFKKFKQVLQNRKGKIKSVLMNQEVIAGIGNLYSDEILFYSKVHPLKRTSELKEAELKKIYLGIKKILTKAIKFQGDSFSDYRKVTGEKGGFHERVKVYRKTGQKCSRCNTVIQRIKVGGRSAHYCPKCQKL